MNTELDQAVTATPVADGERLNFLPWLFNRKFTAGEQAAYAWMSKLAAEDYHGGFWNFYKLSNGSGYMAPAEDKPFRVVNDTNGFEGEMSADAAGIVATLFAISTLFEVMPQGAALNGLIDRYYALRDYAAGHKDVRAIFGAID